MCSKENTHRSESRVLVIGVFVGVWQVSPCPCMCSGQLNPHFPSNYSWPSSQGLCLTPTLLLWADDLLASSAKNQRLSDRNPLEFLHSFLRPACYDLSLSAHGLTTSPHHHWKRHLIRPPGLLPLKPRLSHPHLLLLLLSLLVVSSFTSYTLLPIRDKLLKSSTLEVSTSRTCSLYRHGHTCAATRWRRLCYNQGHWSHSDRQIQWALSSILGSFNFSPVDNQLLFFFFNKFIYFYLFICGCIESVAVLWLSLVAGCRSYSLSRCVGFSLQWLLLLQSMGSRYAGFSSCGTQAQYLWLVGSRAQAQ